MLWTAWSRPILRVAKARNDLVFLLDLDIWSVWRKSTWSFAYGLNGPSIEIDGNVLVRFKDAHSSLGLETDPACDNVCDTAVGELYASARNVL